MKIHVLQTTWFFSPIHQIDSVKEPTWWRLFPLRILSFLLCFAHFSVLSGALRFFFFRLHVFVQLSRLVQYSSSSGDASSFSDSVRSKVPLEVTGPMLNNLYVYRVGSWFFKTQKYLAKIRTTYGSVNQKRYIRRNTLRSKKRLFSVKCISHVNMCTVTVTLVTRISQACYKILLCYFFRIRHSYDQKTRTPYLILTRSPPPILKLFWYHKNLQIRLN